LSRRVVVTGTAGICPLGTDWAQTRAALLEGRSGIAICPAYDEVEGLQTRLAAAVPDFVAEIPRRKLRSMGRVSQLAAYVTDRALRQAGLHDAETLGSGRVGIAYGSTSGSPPAIETYAKQIGVYHTLHGITAAQFVRLMSHTCAANLAQMLEVRGRVLPTCSACTSGSQGIGFAYEAIKWGLQDVMITGGAEELHVICTAVFDILKATSTRNDAPTATPRPFDRDRDGLVVGEGAATLILESLEHARARGAEILAEVIGFATNGNGAHMVNPDPEEMARVQRLALADAGITAEDIDYVSAHATATEVGDLAEARATHDVFGDRVPISSLKGHMGHTLGACGALEAWVAVHQLREGWLPPTLNLEHVDPECARLDHVREVRESSPRTIMTNNYAFGGVNASLILRRFA